MPAPMCLLVLEPEGVWRCNECGEWVGSPEEHAATIHGVFDFSDLILVHTDDI